jgi:acetyl esterase
MSRSDTLRHLDPITRRFVEEVTAPNVKPIYEQAISDARSGFANAQAKRATTPSADVEEHLIEVGPKGSVAIRIVRQQGCHKTLPVVMFFHGGGWVLGDRQTHDRLVREIADGAHAAVVFVEFDRAPESRYPVAVEEAYAATKYIAGHGRAYNLDPSRLAVAGDSAGGNLAAAVCLLARERGGPQIDYQVLFYPVTDAGFDTPSYQEFSTAYLLTAEVSRWFWQQYLPDEAARRQPTASPLRSSLGQLRGLPAALVITAEFDILRDEGEAYAHKLTEAGVPVTAIRVLGTIHDFVTLNALSDAPPARAALLVANQCLRNAFSKWPES